MKKRTRWSTKSKFVDVKSKNANSEEWLQTDARKILDEIFFRKQGRWVSGHELDADEQDNLVGHAYIQIVMRFAAQRVGYLNADGNPTPKVFRAHRKMTWDF